MKPYPHQEEAVKKAKRHFSSNDRGRLIQACGTGKTLSALLIAKEIKAKSILIAIPNLLLENQTLIFWKKNIEQSGLNYKFMAVGSDDSIGKLNDVPVSTNVDEIAFFIQKNENEKLVILTTYHSGYKVADAATELDFVFDFGIADEAHRTAGEDKLFNYIIFPENINVHKWVFMTATEKIIVSRQRKEMVISMDNEELYGEKFYDYPLSDAIKDEVLTDYQILTLFSDKKKIIEWIKDNIKGIDRVRFKEAVELRMLATAISLLKAIEKHKLSKIITYHSSIKKAKRMLELIKVASGILHINISTFHINHTSSSSKVSEYFSQFEQCETGILTNVKSLQEGIDLNFVDAIAFVDQKHSFIDIVQAFGRPLRKHPKKDKAYILLPCFIDEGLFDEKDFESIRLVVAALASNDYRIIEQFKLRERRRSIGSAKLMLGDDVMQVFDVEELSKALELRIWEKTGRLFFRPYKEAKKWGNTLPQYGIFTELDMLSYSRGEFEHPNLPPYPSDIPRNPRSTYNKTGEWEDVYTFLGIAKDDNYQSYKSWFQREYPEINSYLKFKKLDKSGFPKNRPKDPYTYFKRRGEWQGWDDFLNIEKQFYVKYEEFKKWFNSLKVHSEIDTSYKFGKLNKDHFPKKMPKYPRTAYVEFDWSDFFNRSPIEYFSYSEAKEYLNKNFSNLQSKTDFNKQSREGGLSKRIPHHPYGFYKRRGEWKSWIDFLSNTFFSYEAAKGWVNKNHPDLKSGKEFLGMNKDHFPKEMPKTPHVIYKKQETWKGWKDFLKLYWISYDEAKEWIGENHPEINSVEDWRILDKTNFPKNMPKAPRKVYHRKGSWGSWSDFLKI